MTTNHVPGSEEPLEPLELLVRETLHAKANSILVEDRWPEIARRLSAPVPTTRSLPSGGTAQPSGRPDRGRAPRRRGRALLVAACGIGLALILITVSAVSGWRLFDGVGPAGERAPTTVPRYDRARPNLVVYRSNISTTSNEDDPSGFYLSPELRRTDSADIGRAALSAIFETTPVHGEPTAYGGARSDPTRIHEWGSWQKIDVTSVTHADGLIKIELQGFSSHLGASEAARMMVQAWVYTVQDTLGARDPVLIRIQGRPFMIYGEVDTTEPITRDESVPIKQFTGFDTPVTADVVSTPLLVLGWADAASDRPARLTIRELSSGDIVVDQELTSSTQQLAFVQRLRRGRHEIRLDGIDASGRPYSHSIVITVVR